MNTDSKQDELLKILREIVVPWRKLTIVLDGITGCGKSTLGRYLAWQLGMPLIEGDMFRVKEDKPPSYRLKEIQNCIHSRHELDRPVIIESVFSLDILQRIDVVPDYVIYLENSEADEGLEYKEPLNSYYEKYKPKERADYVLCTDYINGM